MFRQRYGWISGRHRRRVEEQRLGDRGFHRGPLERLGDEEGGFRAGPRQQPFGNAVMKITGTENSARMSFTASIPLESSAS